MDLKNKKRRRKRNTGTTSEVNYKTAAQHQNIVNMSDNSMDASQATIQKDTSTVIHPPPDNPTENIIEDDVGFDMVLESGLTMRLPEYQYARIRCWEAYKADRRVWTFP